MKLIAVAFIANVLSLEVCRYSNGMCITDTDTDHVCLSGCKLSITGSAQLVINGSVLKYETYRDKECKGDKLLSTVYIDYLKIDTCVTRKTKIESWSYMVKSPAVSVVHISFAYVAVYLLYIAILHFL
eukprot:GHVR01137226.1.p1 GENE.GHVR01137226.1~~GHVR01137226.1.p1  ORF type:complete len:138 (-),score=4.35 GHVR01137226.1:284-667(-)